MKHRWLERSRGRPDDRIEELPLQLDIREGKHLLLGNSDGLNPVDLVRERRH